MSKQIRFNITSERLTQLEGMCGAFNMTPESFMKDELRDAFIRLAQRYQREIIAAQLADVEIVIEDAPETEP